MAIFNLTKKRETSTGMQFGLGVLLLVAFFLLIAFFTASVAFQNASHGNADGVWRRLLIWAASISVMADASVLVALWLTHTEKLDFMREARRVVRDLESPELNAYGRRELERELRDWVARWRIKDRNARQWLLLLNMLLVLEFTVSMAVMLPVGAVAFLIAMLPMLIIAYHASNLSVDAPCFPELLGNREIVLALEGRKSESTSTLNVARNIGARLSEAYGVPALLLRYWLPAVLLVGVGLADFMFLSYLTALGGSGGLPPGWRGGIAGATQYLAPDAFVYGLMGAYFYVYLQLARRSVRNDITPTIIMWCLLTLSTGPIVAGLLPNLVADAASLASHGSGTGVGATWTTKAPWLFAGYSPRFVVETLARGTASSLRPETRGIEQETRVALSHIQGIGAEEAERLAEEGITEAHGLASVDPLRLMRDTRFDNWRILSWVDQALLISALREDLCKKLQNRGIWGASDINVAELREEQDSPSQDAADLRITPVEEKALDRLQRDIRVQELHLLVKLVHSGITGPEPAKATHPANATT